MKILILTSSFPPEAEGAATHLPEMAAALQKRGHRVQVLAIVNRHEVRDSYSFRVKRISRSQVKFIRNIRILYHLIKAGRKCDAFYVYGIWWQASLAKLFTGVPLVVKFTGDKIWEFLIEKNKTNLDIEDFQSEPQPLNIAFLHSIYRFWARFTSRMIVSCDSLSRVLMSWGISRNDIEIIPNALPVNPKSDEQATYLAQWNNQEELKLITAGHIRKAKQLDKLLHILSRFNHIRLVVAGDGPELDNIKSITTQLNLADRVLFTGKVSRHDLAGYIQESDVLILNSKIGRFNYVILEALKRNKVILATRRGLHGDFIEHGVTGWLYSDNKEDELYELLCDLQAGRRFLNTKKTDDFFTWTKQVELTEETLESCQR